jgi:hypothetical protein
MAAAINGMNLIAAPPKMSAAEITDVTGTRKVLADRR